LRQFRIVARYAIAFQKEIAELGPGYYDCPSNCTRPNADMRRGCPTCEYTIREILFKEDARAHILEGLPDFKYLRQWPLEALYADVAHIASVSAEAGKGYRRSWTVLTRRLVDIYRDEASRYRRAENWGMWVEMKELRGEVRAAAAGPDHKSLGPKPSKYEDGGE
jgi:hypothetical protein